MNNIEAVKRELAPSGRIRVSLNLGNTVLVQSDPVSGKQKGVTVELATALGERLGLPVDFTTFNAAGPTFDAVKRGEIDVVFLARDPVRAKEIEFTPPYVLIEGYFLVPERSALKTPADVDRTGSRISVEGGSAYDLYLTRTIKSAQLVRFPTAEESLQVLLKDKLEAAAGVKQPLVAFMKNNPGLRLIEPRFMAIEQAIGTPTGRKTAATFLHDFIEEMKASGMIAAALKRSDQHDAVVAPASPR